MKLNGRDYPAVIETGEWKGGHIQGIAVDPAKGFVYYSYTTVLVKARLDGTVVGWVGGLMGHLGCIDFNEENGKVYGSLEYKHDVIGKSIAQNLGVSLPEEDAFYICIFDVDQIDRPDMDAERDGVVRSVYLPEVSSWHHKKTVTGEENGFFVSGIDGLGIGPVFGEQAGESRLMLCSSIFSSPEAPYRSECNVVSQYDWRSLDAAAVPLRQDKLHHVGISSETYYFLDIGPCRWGIQNFEYDKGEGIWWTSVYLLQEEPRSKFTLFAVDGKAAPEERKSPFGKKSFLALKKEGAKDEANEILGYAFPLGQTGIYAFGNGFFYFAEPRKTEEGFHSGTIYLYKREIGGESPFVLVGE